MCTVALLSQYEPGLAQPTDLLCLGEAGKPGDQSTGLSQAAYSGVPALPLIWAEPHLGLQFLFCQERKASRVGVVGS